MFLKLMNSEDLPDMHGSKGFTLIECKTVTFAREVDDPKPYAIIDGDVTVLDGNAYILNNAGKTIDSFAHMPAA